MTTQTLKELIKIEFERFESVHELKESIFRVLDLYEKDQKPEQKYYMELPTDEVMYSEICSCNPKNGGNGICGCVMGNKMVPNPKKYTSPKYSTSTTYITELLNEGKNETE